MKRILLVGVGLLVFSAVLRAVYGWLISLVAESVASGAEGERRAIDVIAFVLDMVITIATPLGAALVAGAVVLHGQRPGPRTSEASTSEDNT
ncbi:hypothetical protein ACHAAC_06755 [Aeromicrobium sp. CF4.19]|uniref:hypothetical protein n=1 Tax=Aeromicrobium sp. CF4.19 TaxID=3373082 RepID=UPI003EE51EBB